MKRLMALVLAFVVLTALQAGFAETAITKTETGFGGDVTVTVTFDGDRIVSVEATGDQETQGVGSRAIELLPDQIVQAQSADLDFVSGASMTSAALLGAVKAAISENSGAGAEEAALAMAPGTYTAKAAGFGGNVVASQRADILSIVDQAFVEATEQGGGIWLATGDDEVTFGPSAALDVSGANGTMRTNTSLAYDSNGGGGRVAVAQGVT